MSNGVEANGNQEIHEQELEPILPKPVENLLGCIQLTKDNDKFSSIFEVHSRLRDVNSSSFTPRVVSIGPLHKGGANLKLMEAKKATYLDELLKEVGQSPRETLTKCYEKVMESIEKIKRCYFGLVMDKAHYTNDELAQMMVMDACFILQFVYNLSKSNHSLSNNRLRSRSIGLDLVLLENQIPFFVLQDIYDLTLKRLESIPTLNTMLLDLLERVNPFLEKLKVENLSAEKTPYHILGLLHQFYQPKEDDVGPVIKTIPTAHSAVELYEVGVKFRPNENMKWPMAIEFESSPKPTLKMPKVLIDNFFEVVMRNLIVYEQYTPGIMNYVTSFAMAMDMLAATPADVAKLAESNVLVSYLGSNEKVSKMINSICKDVTFLDFYYIESWKNAKDYYDSYWRKNFGLLKRKYFSTPWKAIALVAAIIIFSVSMVQFVIRIITFRYSH